MGIIIFGSFWKCFGLFLILQERHKHKNSTICFVMKRIFSQAKIVTQCLPRILQIPGTLGKNLGKILTKGAKNMYDFARSCQELQEKCLFFFTQKTHKKGFRTKIFQEKPRILSRNAKNLVKKSKKIQESCQEIRENSRISGEKARFYWTIMNEYAWKGLNFLLFR